MNTCGVTGTQQLYIVVVMLTCFIGINSRMFLPKNPHQLNLLQGANSRMLFTKNPHPLNLLQGASPPSRLTPWYILQGRIPGMSLELKYIIIYSSNVYVFLQELIPLFLPKPRYDLFYFIIMYVALLGIYFMNTVPYFILLCVASLGIYLLIPVTSLEIKNIYYIVCTSALMFFTHTEFRMTSP